MLPGKTLQAPAYVHSSVCVSEESAVYRQTKWLQMQEALALVSLPVLLEMLITCCRHLKPQHTGVSEV